MSGGDDGAIQSRLGIAGFGSGLGRCATEIEEAAISGFAGRFAKVGRITVYPKNHGRGAKTDGCVWISGGIVEKMHDVVHGSLCRGGLLQS
jgi:hypothetical protein